VEKIYRRWMWMPAKTIVSIAACLACLQVARVWAQPSTARSSHATEFAEVAAKIAETGDIQDFEKISSALSDVKFVKVGSGAEESHFSHFRASDVPAGIGSIDYQKSTKYVRIKVKPEKACVDGSEVLGWFGRRWDISNDIISNRNSMAPLAQGHWYRFEWLDGPVGYGVRTLTPSNDTMAVSLVGGCLWELELVKLTGRGK